MSYPVAILWILCSMQYFKAFSFKIRIAQRGQRFFDFFSDSCSEDSSDTADDRSVDSINSASMSPVEIVPVDQLTQVSLGKWKKVHKYNRTSWL